MSLLLSPILTGFFGALIVASPDVLRWAFPGGVPWGSPYWPIAIAGLAIVIFKFNGNPQKPGSYSSYDGVSDIMIHIHSPSNQGSPSGWVARGVVSFFLSLFCGVGPEGAAVEFEQGFLIRARSPLSRWFEQRRRNDAGVSIAAGIGAAFGAPFAGVILPLELGMGGRTLSAVISGLCGFLGVRFIGYFVPLTILSPGRILSGVELGSIGFSEACILAGVAVLAAILGIALVKLIHFGRANFLELFRGKFVLILIAGGLLLTGLALVSPEALAPPTTFFRDTFGLQRSHSEMGFLFFSRFLALFLLFSVFGTFGVFWPLFALGGLMGFGIFSWAGAWIGALDFGPMAALAGGAALLGVIFGAPLSGALIAFEMGNRVEILLPCLAASILANEIRKRLKGRTLMDVQLEARGSRLKEGRSAAVMDSILVRDAMVKDFQTVQETDSVLEVQARLSKSPYPFLPVINSQKKFVGLLTADMVRRRWTSEVQAESEPGSFSSPPVPGGSNIPLPRLLEAKDLLYRAEYRPPTLLESERLSTVGSIFDRLACLPVLTDDERVAGLLFGYNVRLAYDREVAHRFLSKV